MRQLWNDEAAFVVSADLVLVSSILVLGLMVGLATLRDQIVQELADVGVAFSALNQGFDWDGITGHTSSVAGSAFADTTDFCDVDNGDVEPVDAPALGIVVNADAQPIETPSGL